MADDGEDVVIPVDPGESSAVEVVVEKPIVAAPVVAEASPLPARESELSPKIVTADEGIENLKEQIARARAESEQRLSEKDRLIQQTFQAAKLSEERRIAAEREITTVKQGAVLTVLENLKRDKDDARRDYKAAMEAGDFERATDAQDRLSLANAKLVHAERGKQELEEQAKNPPAAPVVTPSRPLASDDKVEEYASNLSARSASWVRQHPEFAKDETKKAQMVRAHFSAMGEGHETESDAYFDFINRKLGITPADQGRQAVQQDASRAPASAPVSRETPQSQNGGSRPNTVHLTGSERRTAIDTLSSLYPNKTEMELLQIYARQKVKLMNEGKIGRVAS